VGYAEKLIIPSLPSDSLGSNIRFTSAAKGFRALAGRFWAKLLGISGSPKCFVMFAAG
jgi:hypothetical protein